MSAKDFIREKFDTFISNKGQKHLFGRNPLPNELLGLVEPLITFVVAIFNKNKIPKEEWLNWASHVHHINTFIIEIEEHFTTNVTKTGFKKLVRSYKALLAQSEEYFGSQQWQKFKELEIMPKTYFSSNVLVDEELAAVSSADAKFQEDNVDSASPNHHQTNPGFVARSSAFPQTLLVNETLSNSPKVRDISMVREYASNMNSNQEPNPAATPRYPHSRQEAEDDLDINIQEDSDEDGGSSSDGMWDYDLPY